MPLPIIASETHELLDTANVLRDLRARVAPGRPLGLLNAEAARRGYKLATGPKNVLGYRETIKATQEVKAPRGEVGAAVKDVSFELSVQDLTKAGSKDKAALATLTLRAGGNSETYEILLEAPGGDFAKAREYMVKNNVVVPTKSWWTAMRTCLKNRCIGTCVTALITCSGTWAAYLGCVAVVCGSCWVKCAACAGCNCKWWCKWAVGCCKR